MEDIFERETVSLINNIYKHPIITCMLFGTFCYGLAALISSFKK